MALIPTTCRDCNGTGLSKRAAGEHVTSRMGASSERARLKALQCFNCQGKGRLYVSDDVCGHGLDRADCHLCRTR